MSVFVRARARPTQNQSWTCGPAPYAWPTYEFAELAAAAEVQAAKAHAARIQASATRPAWPGALHALAGQL